MERHLLVTVSEQKSALFGLRFVGHFFSNKEGLKLTLFYTAPKPSAGWEDDRDPKSVSQSRQQAKQYEEMGRKALEEGQKALYELGFKQNQLVTKLKSRQSSKVKDIIFEGETGYYDAVVLGRRGPSWLEEMFDESVTKGLLDQKVAFPMWICRRPDFEHKNVLVCLDGSEPSYRMADHVGFIFGQEKRHGVTLLVVGKPGALRNEVAEGILAKGREKLLANGFPEDMTSTKLVDSTNVAKAILSEAAQSRYAVVAMGRTGKGGGFLKKIFMGSVSTTLFRELEKNALWICY